MGLLCAVFVSVSPPRKRLADQTVGGGAGETRVGVALTVKSLGSFLTGVHACIADAAFTAFFFFFFRHVQLFIV